MVESSPDETAVLYCEDAREYAELVVEWLSNLETGLAVTHVESGPAALEAFDPETYDCLLSDYDMPEMDGLELLAAFREAYPEVPFVLYTQRGSEDVASEAIREGVTDYIRKASTESHFELLATRITNAVSSYRTEQLRQKLATRYELVERASPDAFWDRDMRTDTVELGRGFEDAFGYEPGVRERSFEWWYDRVHPDDRGRVVSEIEAAIDREEQFYEGELRFRRADGTYADIAGRGHIVYEDGRPVREVGVAVDLEWRDR